MRSSLLSTLSGLSYLVLLTVLFVASFLSCISLLSQAVRIAPETPFKRNFNIVVIGAAYGLVLFSSGLIILNRRIAIRLRLQRISRSYSLLRKSDLPKPVYIYNTQEYARSCLIAHASIPKDIYHPGWGRPGTELEGIRFRRSLLGTIKVIDELSKEVLPSQRSIKPNLRMLLQFRFLIPLLPQDEVQLSALHYYDSVIEIARYSASEPTENEYIQGMEAFTEIQTCLEEHRLGLLEEDSNCSTHVDRDNPATVSN